MIDWISHSDQHQGRRSYQEDGVAVFRDPSRQIWFGIVSDGVGGHGGGDKASQLVIESAAKIWRDLSKSSAKVVPRCVLEDLCRTANSRIAQMGRESGVKARATIVALFILENRACWVHSGDSRLYHFRNGVCQRRTRDHSVLQILVEQGKVREEDMGSHADQSRLLQGLGDDVLKEPDFGELTVGDQDAFLLCTDGFWEKIRVEEMQRLVSDRDGLRSALKATVTLAADRGGATSDNVSAAVVAGRAPWPVPDRAPGHIEVGAPSSSNSASTDGPGRGRRKGRLRLSIAILLLVAVASILTLIRLLSVSPKPGSTVPANVPQSSAAPNPAPENNQPNQPSPSPEDNKKSVPNQGPAKTEKERAGNSAGGSSLEKEALSAWAELQKAADEVQAWQKREPMTMPIWTDLVGKAQDFLKPDSAIDEEYKKAAMAMKKKQWHELLSACNKVDGRRKKLLTPSDFAQIQAMNPEGPLKVLGLEFSCIPPAADLSAPALWVTRSDLTYEQYWACSKSPDGSSLAQLPEVPKTGKLDRSITGVSWNKAQQIAQALTQCAQSETASPRLKPDWSIALPSDREWLDNRVVPFVDAPKARKTGVYAWQRGAAPNPSTPGVMTRSQPEFKPVKPGEETRDATIRLFIRRTTTTPVSQKH